MTDSDTDDSDAIAQRIATSVREQLDDNSSSRRKFLSRSALAGGTLLALGGGAGAALAQEDEHMDAEEITATFDDVSGTDIDVLNYALTLEHLEDVFYREGLEMFDMEDFVAADSLQNYDQAFREEVFGYVESVAEHEATHVEVLTQSVELLGGDPAQEATYNFGFETVTDFLELGQVFENLGVSAYAGAAPYVESPDLLGVALSIHSVEARHAAVLNQVTGNPPAPTAFDPASSQQDVLDAAGQFIEAETPTPTPDGNGTEMPDGNGTEMPDGNGTDTPDGN